ncbi:MAG: sugar kinase [Bacteroidales bacterium]|nr:sugar kinase [Bacteroidales bacterium]
MKIVTFGEILLRLSKHNAFRLSQGNSFDAQYGGSEANVAISLAQLGNNVEFITRVPDNGIGEAACMHLREFGLSTRHIVHGGKRIGSYYFEPAAAMRGSKVVYDREDSSFNTIQEGDINWDPILNGTGLFHCSGITCATSRQALQTTLEAVRLADSRGIELTCDINYRKNLWQYEGADARKSLNELMQYSSFIFGDQNEWYVASGLEPIPYPALDKDFQYDIPAYEAYFARLHEMFPRCKRMLMAHRNQLSFEHHVIGGVLWAEGQLYFSRIYDVQPIIDQMGVGDAWVAAFIHARQKWPDDDQYCADFATSAAALKNTIPGDQNLVTEEEIISNMHSSGNGRVQR